MKMTISRGSALDFFHQLVLMPSSKRLISSAKVFLNLKKLDYPNKIRYTTNFQKLGFCDSGWIAKKLQRYQKLHFCFSLFIRWSWCHLFHLIGQCILLKYFLETKVFWPIFTLCFKFFFCLAFPNWNLLNLSYSL